MAIGRAFKVQIYPELGVIASLEYMVQERLRYEVIFALKFCQFLCVCGVKVENLFEERPALFPFYICTRFDEKTHPCSSKYRVKFRLNFV